MKASEILNFFIFSLTFGLLIENDVKAFLVAGEMQEILKLNVRIEKYLTKIIIVRNILEFSDYRVEKEPF